MRQIDGSGPGDGSQNQSSLNESPRIAVFPKGPTPWRIYWFGDIAFPDRSIRSKQPSVFVQLSRVTDSRFRDDPAVLLSANSTAPPNFQRRVWVSVGTLPLLRVGDTHFRSDRSITKSTVATSNPNDRLQTQIGHALVQCAQPREILQASLW